MTISNDEINTLAGLSAKKETKPLPLMSDRQKSEQLDPPQPWYAVTRNQVGLIAIVVIGPLWLLYSLFTNSGGGEAKVVKAPASARELTLQQQLDSQKKELDDAKQAAAFNKQNGIVAVPVTPNLKNPKNAKVKSSAPPAQYVSKAPVVIRQVAQAPQAAPRPLPQVTPVRRVAPTPFYPPVAQSLVPKEDPNAAWKRLADLGSYGGDSSGGIGSSGPVASNAVYTSPSAATNPVIESDYTPVPDTQPSGGPIAANTYPESVGGGDTTHSVAPSMGGVSIAAGTKAKAELSMPIVWSQDIKIDNDEFLATLNEPLGSALPKGTIIVLKPEQVSAAGLIRLTAIRATVNGQDRPLPDGIKVVASDGGFIKADEKKPGSGFGLRDILGVVLGGARTATSLINQPSNQTSFSNGNFTSTTTNQNTNLLAAFGQGAADSLISRAQNRAQQIQSNRSPYFSVGEGTKVKLLLTQTISF